MKPRKKTVVSVFFVLALMLVFSLDSTAGIRDFFTNAGKKSLGGMGKGLGSTSWIGEGMGYFLRITLVYKLVFGGFLPKYALSFSNNFYEAILSNPSPQDPAIFNLIGFFIEILQPLYILVIMAVGFYLLFLPISPSARSSAKKMLTRLLISMVLLSLSIPIMNMMLDISAGMTESVFALVSPVEVKKVLGGAVTNVFWIFALLNIGSSEMGLPYLMLLFAMAFLPYLAVTLRYILVTLFITLFPLSLFLYSVPMFRGMGRRMLEQTIVWTFLQVFTALIIVVYVGIGITIEDAFVNNATISFTNLRAMYDMAGILSAGAPTVALTSWLGGWGAIISGVAGLAGLAITEHMLDFFYESMPATLSIVDFVLGLTIYAMLMIFPLVWSELLHDFLP